MCAEAVTATVNVLVERLANAISQTLCPSEIWFAKKLGNMVCLEQRNPDAEHEQQQHRCDHLSSPATAAGWRGGEGCSHPAAHQIGRSTISNSAGNSWDIFINVLKVFRRSVMQCCQWIDPPCRARLVRFSNPLAFGSGLGERILKKVGFQLWRSFSRRKKDLDMQKGVYLESSMRTGPVFAILVKIFLTKVFTRASWLSSPSLVILLPQFGHFCWSHIFISISGGAVLSYFFWLFSLHLQQRLMLFKEKKKLFSMATAYYFALKDTCKSQSDQDKPRSGKMSSSSALGGWKRSSSMHGAS